MDVLFAAEAAVRKAVPSVVAHHKSEEGALTWALIHRIEAEVLGDVASTGKHSKRILDMIRAPALLEYPKDDRLVSFTGHDVVPIVFKVIDEAWHS
ncbi:DUF2471 family protein [Caballeronia glathei]|jgi:hypothetical protein|uniref:DUF2471 domain-containing protein n=1 Tax=Caballeronia glathei TaxID=60547 RepID=A0A069PFV3_9BURK|nr:DUF2471 family protein [Caballeronia glathei]KDR38704.1 hypothetical protein BG61_37850 [Caballeronia glathei]